jgi:hypothetical protein
MGGDAFAADAEPARDEKAGAEAVEAGVDGGK